MMAMADGSIVRSIAELVVVLTAVLVQVALEARDVGDVEADRRVLRDLHLSCPPLDFSTVSTRSRSSSALRHRSGAGEQHGCCKAL